MFLLLGIVVVVVIVVVCADVGIGIIHPLNHSLSCPLGKMILNSHSFQQHPRSFLTGQAHFVRY